MNEPIWLEEALVLALHEQLIRDFGGQAGVRDLGLLSSALARPQNVIAYEETPSIARLAGAYAFGLVRNHPFLDGNKRTGFAAADVFLQLNGHELTASEVEAVFVFRDLAAGEIGRG